MGMLLQVGALYSALAKQSTLITDLPMNVINQIAAQLGERARFVSHQLS